MEVLGPNSSFGRRRGGGSHPERRTRSVSACLALAAVSRPKPGQGGTLGKIQLREGVTSENVSLYFGLGVKFVGGKEKEAGTHH